MSTCEHFEELCSAFAEQAPKGEESIAFEAHLKTCSECRAKVERIRVLRHQLRSLSGPKATPDFETVLRTRIQLSKSIGRSSLIPLYSTYRIPLLAAAAILLMIIVPFVIRNLTLNPAAHETRMEARRSGVAGSPSMMRNNITYSLDMVQFPQENLLPGSKYLQNKEGAQQEERTAAKAANSDSSRLREEILRNLKSRSQPVSF